MEFASWLQAEMGKYNLTKYQVAKISGIHQTTVAKLLGGAKPQMETERKIRNAMQNMSKSLSPKTEQTAAPEGNGLPEEFARLFAGLAPEDQTAVIADMLRRGRAKGK